MMIFGTVLAGFAMFFSFVSGVCLRDPPEETKLFPLLLYAFLSLVCGITALLMIYQGK